MASFFHPSHHRQKELLDAIITHLLTSGGLPLSLVEQVWFIAFMKVVDPKYKIPSRYKVNSSKVQTFKRKVAGLESKLLDVKHVSITLRCVE